MSALSHTEINELLPAAALDALSPAEAFAVQSHVATCRECAADLASLREAAAAIGMSMAVAPVETVRASAMRARLVARASVAGRERTPGVRAQGHLVGSGTLKPSSVPTPVVPIRRFGPATWVAIAASVAWVATSLAWNAAREERDAVQGALAAEMARAGQATASADSLRATLASLTGSDVALVQMVAANPRAPHGLMFWDRATDRWVFVAHNMPALASGRTYQLWLVTGKDKISGGTFNPVNGTAMVQMTYPLARDALAAIAVTEEPEGGVPVATGQIVVVGTYASGTK